MYLSTKLALSSVVIGSIFASIVQSAQAAGISFTPTGGPLDDDPIFDIETKVGAHQPFTVNIDQAGLAVGDIFEFQVGWDSTELGLKAMGFQHPGGNSSDLSVTLWNSKEQGQYQVINYQYIVNELAHPGIAFDFEVLPGLINNGNRDFWVSADARTFKSYQEVEVQPCCPKPILTPNSLINYFALIPSSLFSLFFGEPAFAGELGGCSSCSVPEPITGLILGGLAAGGVMMNRKKNKTA
jgi:hypothetical protein